MNKKYEVRLSTEERNEIQLMLHNPKTCAGLRKRCLVLIQLDESQGTPPTQAEIARRCQVSEVTVTNVVGEFAKQGLKSTLSYKKRAEPARTRRVTGEVEARIVALACEAPPVGYARWTLRLLAKRVVELEILPMASKDMVHRVLKKRNLSLT